MKKLAITLLLIPAVSYAEYQVPFTVVCDDTSVIVKALRKEYMESTMVISKGLGNNPHMLSVWINPETKTMTIVDTYEKTSCVLGVGAETQILDPAPTGPGT